jgi:GcrA cell cycle regulator
MTKPLPAGEGKTTPWTDDRVAELLRRAKDGEAASAIAKHFGKSRCAVLGKLDRMKHAGQTIERRGAILKQGSSPAKGVAARPAPSLQVVALSGVPAVKRGRPFNPRGVAPALPAPVEPVPFVNGARITLLQLTSQTCKWPIGDPQQADFCFCGHQPRENSPYCDYHARAAYVPLEHKRQRVFA